MFLHENENFFKKNNPNLWKELFPINIPVGFEKLTRITSKTGLPSLQIEVEGQQAYLHSKYDPMNEAEQWIHKYEDQLNQCKQIVCYGIGFGYHVEYILNKYPDKWITLYEPNPTIFYEYLCNCSLNRFSMKNIKSIYVENEQNDLETSVMDIIESSTDEFLIISHPVYERIYKEKTKEFYALFKEKVFYKKTSALFRLQTKGLWVVNCSQNFRKVLQTANAIRGLKNFLSGKPVLLVAAGPSLEEEIDHIRKIKKQGTAYIFAVGSANKALLYHGIYPDAIISYDPYDRNIQVFDKVIEDHITEIPLIFGSSVGHRTVTSYPGPMLHLITQRDFIAQYYLQKEHLIENNEISSDELSIAIVTLNWVINLGCEQIILVGQNFAFKKEQLYSQGITYTYRTNEMNPNEKKEALFVESVEGDQVLTTQTFDLERLAMEKCISQFKDGTVINTTNGGAKILGAHFMDLQTVMSKYLHNRVVDPDWYKDKKTDYNKEKLYKQANEIGFHHKKLPILFAEIIEALRQTERFLKPNYKERLNKSYLSLGKLVNQLNNNHFYNAFILLDLQYETDILNKKLDTVKSCVDLTRKIEVVVETYKKYIPECQEVYHSREQLFLQFQEYIYEFTNELSQ